MEAGKRPVVLFVCVHNAGRSQMAAGFLSHLAQGGVEVISAGWAAGTPARSTPASVTRTGICPTRRDSRWLR